jgi:hypothetical protein
MRRLVSLLLLVGAQVALAQPTPALSPLVGVTEVAKQAPASGFIDDVVASDDARLAYIVTDGSTKAELHVLTVATNADQAADITAVTLHPIGLTLVGQRAFVIGQAEDGQQVAALVEIAGKKPGAVVYKLGPATHITVIDRDGKQRVAVHKEVAPTKATIREEIALHALESGARLGGGSLDIDEQDNATKLEFRINHWIDGMTKAIGVKGGTWDPKENERMPDSEATYDMVSGKFTEKKKIADLFEQRKRFQVLQAMGNESPRGPVKRSFFKYAWDNTSIALWHDGVARTLELDQALDQYDPKSIQGVVAADGSAWFALKIDPTNPAAVSRKKADPEYLDIFHVGTDTKATRKARILAKGHRYWFGMMGEKIWLLDRSNGLERGSSSLTLYKL